MKLNLKVLGLDDLQSEIDSVSKELAEAEDPAALAAGEPIKEAWVGLVPVDEGNYRDSLTVAWLGKQGAAVGTRWLPQLPREEQPFIYSKRLEFGTSGTRAQPSARPALEASRASALEAAGDSIRPVVKGRRPRRKVPKA